MKKFILIVIALSVFCTSQAVDVKITSGVSSPSIASTMEQNASKLLTEVNSACLANRSLILSGISCESDFGDDINMLWENLHFSCDAEQISTAGIKTQTGYQIRNIVIRVIPTDGTTIDEQASIKEGIINFTSDGRIRYFVMADDAHVGADVLKKGAELNDLTRRLQILDFVEQYRTAYNKKDLPFINDIFSDDALIITGKVIRRVPGSEVNPNSDLVVYRKETKTEYVNRLSIVFKKNNYINVKFDDVKIYRHVNAQKYPNVYGVLVTQHWSSSTYSDVGYVFMLWDFTNENEPKIRVRTWQPKYLDDSRTQTLDEDEIFDPSFFDLNTK
ncbi:MAG: nuclear transport factor 2 family protein [Paludibacteraceae bacterium]|nr:nuclear transport factor 2 family protein [Paludibacteraceae bacterium]